MKSKIIPFEKRIPPKEMARRYREVRDLMRSEAFDLLLVSGNSQLNQRGHLRYLTNWAQPLFEEYALLPLEGDIIYFSRYALRAQLVKSYCKIADVRHPQYGKHRLGNVPAQQLAEIIRDLAPSKIGIVGLETMAADFYLALKKNLAGFRVADAAHILHQVRMLKSSKELEFVKLSASLGDHAFGVFAGSVRPGKREFEAIIEVDSAVKKLGAEDTFFLTGSGRFPQLKFYNMAYRTYRPGDLVIFTIELAGPGGYFTQIVRTLSIGEPNQKIRAAHDACLEAMSETSRALKPGARASEVYRTLKQTFERRSMRMDMNTGHGQGLDIFEPPLISEFDHTELKPGMVIILHPRVFISAQANVWVGNTFLVTERGSTCLNRATDDLVIV